MNSRKRAAAVMYRSQIGQTLVEMALVLPIFILMVMGIFDLGRAVWQANTVAEAARQGVRYAITAPSDCTGIKSAATEAAIGVKLTASPVTISEPSGVSLGRPVTVTVTGTFTPVTPLIATVVKKTSFTITRASTMIIENASRGSQC